MTARATAVSFASLYVQVIADTNGTPPPEPRRRHHETRLFKMADTVSLSSLSLLLRYGLLAARASPPTLSLSLFSSSPPSPQHTQTRTLEGFLSHRREAAWFPHVDAVRVAGTWTLRVVAGRSRRRRRRASGSRGRKKGAPEVVSVSLGHAFPGRGQQRGRPRHCGWNGVLVVPCFSRGSFDERARAKPNCAVNLPARRSRSERLFVVGFLLLSFSASAFGFFFFHLITSTSGGAGFCCSAGRSIEGRDVLAYQRRGRP